MSYNDDLSEYNGNAEHDMWVDYDYSQNTGEYPYLDAEEEYYEEEYYEEDLDSIISKPGNYETADGQSKEPTRKTTHYIMYVCAFVIILDIIFVIIMVLNNF